MDEMMNLVNGIGTGAAEVSNTLSEIGNMFDGITDMYINALEFGQEIGYKKRLLEEPQKVVVGGVCFLIGAGITAGGVWIAKRIRAKKKEAHKQSEEFIDDTTSFNELEAELEKNM